MSHLPQRPRLALPFTILTSPQRVRLVAGEDFRYTLEGPNLDGWLPHWLSLLDGTRLLAEVLAALPEEHRAAAREIVARLHGERVLIEGPAAAAHVADGYALEIEGDGKLAAALTTACQQEGSSRPRVLKVLCQDRLDYAEALQFNRRCLAGSTPWLWASSAALSRGYAGPLFLPRTGPCLECLLRHFQRRSPLPELYDELTEHTRRGGKIAPTPLAARPLALLVQLVLGKAELMRTTPPPAALFRLHVLDAATLEITAHRVFVDLECPACATRSS